MFLKAVFHISPFWVILIGRKFPKPHEELDFRSHTDEEYKVPR